MEQLKSCLNCGNFVGKNCSKPTEAKKYCLANSEYELWIPLSEETLKERQDELSKAQQTEVLEDFMEEESLDENQEESFENEEASEEDLQQAKEQFMAMGLDESQADELLQTIKTQEEEKDFKGFNGIRKPDKPVIVSDTCEGCKNDSIHVGCFINMYAQCVSDGRYLYEHKDGLAGTTTGLEGQQDEELKAKIRQKISLDELLSED